MPSVDHIRVGFVNAECRYWPVKSDKNPKWGKGARELCDHIWTASVNGRVDLVLGIIPNGASYLLLPRTWVGAWNERVGGPAFSARSSYRTEYASLSPIHFLGPDDLFKKLKEYEQNSTKKKKLKIADCSKANQRYFMDSGDKEVKIGNVRADFEHSRLFFALLRPDHASQQLPKVFRQSRADLPRLRMDAYAVHPRSALSHARVLALSFSTVSAGTDADARIIDIGWCDVSVQSASTSNAVNCLFHDQCMKVTEQRYNHDSVASEILGSDVISSRLRHIFASARPSSPLILLVHGAKNTCKRLDDLGFRTSSWYDSIHRVLYTGGLRDRERSRSPSRRGSVKRRSPSPPQSSSAIHIIDVEALASCAQDTVAQDASTNHARVRRILENATPFGLDVEGREIEVRLYPADNESPMVKKTMYNAGHDSILIAETWLGLCDGPDIDELRDMLGQDRSRGPADNSPSPLPDPQHEHNDNDDPNFPAPASGAGGPQQSSSKGMTEAYDDLPDEEGDW